MKFQDDISMPHTHTYIHTHTRTSRNQYVPHFFKVGGIKKRSRKGDDAIFPTITLSVARETSGRIWPNFELIQALMHFLITCKYEKDPIKIEEKM